MTAPETTSGIPQRDPVCWMDVMPEEAAATHEHGGKKYYFCNTMCAERFVAEPEKFLAADYDPMRAMEAQMAEASYLAAANGTKPAPTLMSPLMPGEARPVAPTPSTAPRLARREGGAPRVSPSRRPPP